VAKNKMEQMDGGGASQKIIDQTSNQKWKTINKPLYSTEDVCT